MSSGDLVGGLSRKFSPLPANRAYLRWISRAFFLQDLAAKVIGMLPPMIQNNFGKYDSLKKAFYITSHDAVEGDYLEFGVYTGASLSAAVHLSRPYFLSGQRKMRYVGFDSFQGFGKLLDEEKAHPWYKDAHFESSADMVRRRLEKLLDDPKRLELVCGYFEETLKDKKPADYGIQKAAVILIDCDTFSAANQVLEFIAPALQEGTILVIDDFFVFKGSTTLGVYGAFRQFEQKHPEWTLRRMWDYGCGGIVYIVSK